MMNISACILDKKNIFAFISSSEALPRLDNYRISKRALKRPSLGELHGEPQQKIVSTLLCRVCNNMNYLLSVYTLVSKHVVKLST